SDYNFLNVPSTPKSRNYRAELLSRKNRKIDPDNTHNKRELYNIFDRMYHIGRSGYTRETDYSEYMSLGKVFLRQAEYMKDFTDDYTGFKPLEFYLHPIYDYMDIYQLRTYFTWRTKVRSGEVNKTSTSYAFCYIYELINSIGVESPLDGMRKLIFIWEKYRMYANQLDYLMDIWIKDYYVIHYLSMDQNFFEWMKEFPKENANIHDEETKEVLSCAWDKLKIIELSSSFYVTDGRFYKTANEEVKSIIERCICYVLTNLRKHFGKRDIDLNKLFYSIRQESDYTIFLGAIFDREGYENSNTCYQVKINARESYKKRKCDWCKEVVIYNTYNSAVGFLLKAIEVKMRQHFNCKLKLKMPSITPVVNCFLNSESNASYNNMEDLNHITPWKKHVVDLLTNINLESVIEQFIKEFCQKHYILIEKDKITEVKPVNIDLTKLDKIRDDHYQTAEKLHTEEKDDEPVNLHKTEQKNLTNTPPAAGGGISGFLDDLTNEERRLIHIVLNHQSISEIEDPELLVDDINEKALHHMEDNLIENIDGQYSIYEEYQGELEIFKGENR
ncbi:MAG: TerB N-terminal domain-containing protein, partial [Lachnoclostridium sp.]|nr:TerB N-terminal domain-containing protein [Lachnoclostridium sp.]